MSLLRTVVFTTFLLVSFSGAQWKYRQHPWECDDCEDVEMDRNSSAWKCLNSTELSSVNFAYSLDGEGTCRNISGKANAERFCVQKGSTTEQFFVRSCSGPIADDRIPCRRPGDRMLWYRGKQSVSAFGGECISWSDAPFQFDDLTLFDTAFSPSLLDSFRNQHVHQHENFCRNLNRVIHGPWCYVRDAADQTKLKPEPCFLDCVDTPRNESRMCLGKKLFPYTLDGKIHPARSEHWLNDDRIVAYSTTPPPTFNIRDLSDILDVTEAIGSSPVPQSNPLYSFRWNYQFAVDGPKSSRKRCFQEGRRTRVAGPWMYVSGSTHSPQFHNKEFTTNLARDQLYGEPHPKLFRPCFYACEDIEVECFPDVDFPYFGLKSETTSKEQCLTFHEAANKILKRNKNPLNVTHEIGRSDGEERVYLVLFFHPKIAAEVERNDHGDPIYDWIINDFARSDGANLDSNKCLNIANLIHGYNTTKVEKLHNELKRILNAGPGCFVELEDGTVRFKSCFTMCNCSEVVNEPSYRRKYSVDERIALGRSINGEMSQTNMRMLVSEELVDNVNIFGILLVSIGGTFSAFAASVCILIALHKM
ncbi:hypothetical protein QR680_013283 [Steinernema hermaphroditum]|uniref:Kringle domain-containing protein n=1 Tax=Steinernema hermaphroditum TaxID=289476 RepID=A0AA39I7L2_9BILA|nr:hypothetical protein QR680_013283 [Steinernema hermaphroditum]